MLTYIHKKKEPDLIVCTCNLHQTLNAEHLDQETEANRTDKMTHTHTKTHHGDMSERGREKDGYSNCSILMSKRYEFMMLFDDISFERYTNGSRDVFTCSL